MSKRRPVDPRQQDLFDAPIRAATALQAGDGPGGVPGGTPVDVPVSAPGDRDQGVRVAPEPQADTRAPGRVAAPEAAVKTAPPVPPVEDRGAARALFRRVEPALFRAADRADRYLYCVATSDVADRMLREGLPAEDMPPLVERGTVARRLALVADELAWSDEQPGAIVVLRVPRGEVASEAGVSEAGAAAPGRAGHGDIGSAQAGARQGAGQARAKRAGAPRPRRTG